MSITTIGESGLTVALGIPTMLFVVLFILSVILNWKDTTNPFKGLVLDYEGVDDYLFKPYQRFDYESLKGVQTIA
jgi:hypothetical protein